MVNKHNKGNRYEKEARDLLIEEGYLVDRKNWSRYASKDFFTLFDILAIGKHTRLIQVKTNASDFYKARKEIGMWLSENTIKGISFEVWLREPRKAWRKEIMTA